MYTIGIFMTAENEQARRHVDGVLEYVAEHPDLKVEDFCYRGDSPDLDDPPPWIGKAHGIVASVPRMPGILPWLRRGRVPVVAAGSDLKKDLPSVHYNPRSIARLGVEHFLSLGFKHFAHLGYGNSDGSKATAGAIAKELARHKLPLLTHFTEKRLTGTYTDFASLDEIEPELLKMIRNAEKPLALITINDRFAAGVCRILQAMGLAVPGDVAVLGVRDLEIARISTPPISTIRLDDERLAHEASRLLHRLMRGEKLPRRVVLVPAMELVERESTVGKMRALTTDVQRALEYIRQKACDGIRVEDVANHVCMSLRTFELQFAAATGRTVGEEIRTVRLERAKHLLETTDLPISSVARLIAMNDGSYLNHFFQRWTGTTPLKYRRQRRAGK
jgi:LacI family transcriptional regulator